jgi:hypothetical protein
VLDDDDNVLLVHFDGDGVDLPGGFWACPVVREIECLA